jgi:hypothetical protein
MTLIALVLASTLTSTTPKIAQPNPAFAAEIADTTIPPSRVNADVLKGLLVQHGYTVIFENGSPEDINDPNSFTVQGNTKGRKILITIRPDAKLVVFNLLFEFLPEVSAADRAQFVSSVNKNSLLVRACTIGTKDDGLWLDFMVQYHYGLKPNQFLASLSDFLQAVETSIEEYGKNILDL